MIEMTTSTWVTVMVSVVTSMLTDAMEGLAKLYRSHPISNIPTNGESGKRARDGVLEVEYGYYPQRAVSRDMQERLERAYRSSSISKIGNSYTTDSVGTYDYNDYDTAFQPQTHQEYDKDDRSR